MGTSSPVQGKEQPINECEWDFCSISTNHEIQN